MPNFYDAKQTKPTPIGTVHGWTASGLYCHESKQNCSGCPVAAIGIFHKRSQHANWVCAQPESNKQLIAAGILPKEERDAG